MESVDSEDLDCNEKAEKSKEVDKNKGYISHRVINKEG